MLITPPQTSTLSPSLTITNQSIGAASSSQGFEIVDSLLGLGPTGLTYGTITEQPNSKIPTISDNLCSQCYISSEVVGISFNPTTSLSSGDGELTFGGVDRAGTLALSRIHLSHQSHQRSTTEASTNLSRTGHRERSSSERQPELSTRARRSCSLQATPSADT